MEFYNDVERAIYFAAKAFGNRLDRGGEPPLLHALRVASKPSVSNFQRVVAILHDVVEDTDVSLYDISDEFGESVAKSVDAITQRESETYFQYIERVRADWFARVVKLADLEDNLSPERIGKLPEHEQDSLRKRWEKAYRRLVFEDLT